MHKNAVSYDELLKLREELQNEEPEKVDVRKLKVIALQIARYEAEMDSEEKN
jgi:hypothetical protein